MTPAVLIDVDGRMTVLERCPRQDLWRVPVASPVRLYRDDQSDPTQITFTTRDYKRATTDLPDGTPAFVENGATLEQCRITLLYVDRAVPEEIEKLARRRLYRFADDTGRSWVSLYEEMRWTQTDDQRAQRTKLLTGAIWALLQDPLSENGR